MNDCLGKGIIFLYSLETFIPYELNRAIREKDRSKCNSLEPMAWALSYLI